MSSLLWLLACAEDPKVPVAPVEEETRTPLPTACGALPAASGGVIVDDLVTAVASAQAGDVLLLEAGTYNLDTAVEIAVEGLTIRSLDGDPAGVVIEGGYAAASLFDVRAADFLLAEVTLQRSYDAAVNVLGAPGAWVWGVDVLDPEGPGVAAVPWQGAYADDGVVACSTFTRTETCDGAIEGTQAAGWSVWGNTVRQAICDAGAIKFATGSADTVIERNVVFSGQEGIALGDLDYDADEPRIHDHACAGGDQLGHYGGLVVNNLVSGSIRLENACGASVLHDTATGGIGWTSGESLVVRNNLASVNDTGGADVSGNLAPGASDFVSDEDLHLAAGSAAIDAGIAGDTDVDVDGEARDATPDVGADEVVP